MTQQGSGSHIRVYSDGRVEALTPGEVLAEQSLEAYLLELDKAQEAAGMEAPPWMPGEFDVAVPVFNGRISTLIELGVASASDLDLAD